MTAAERDKADAKRYMPRFTTEAPTRMVRPVLPNNFDATTGGKASVERVAQNTAQQYQLEPVNGTRITTEQRWQKPSLFGTGATTGVGGGIAGGGGIGGTPQSSLRNPLKPATATSLIDQPSDMTGWQNPDSASPEPAQSAPLADTAMNAQQRWMQEGGSQRTWNRANVARGVRSAIDSRSRPSPANGGSGASNAIQAAWGWGKKGLPY